MASGWGLVVRGTSCVISVWSLHFWRGERIWRLNSITNGQWSNQSCLHGETSIKPRKQWALEGLQVGKHIHVLGGWCTPTPRGRSSYTQDPFHLALCTSSCGYPFVSFMINCNGKQSIFLSSVSHRSKLWNPEEGVVGSLDFVAKLDQVWETWGCDTFEWHLKWVQSCGLSP